MQSLVRAIRGTGGSVGSAASAPCPQRRSRGQSLVEFSLVLPIMLILLLAIVDFSRIFTSMVTVESAAREAADFGSFNLSNWSPSNVDKTLAAMEQRWCVASSGLPDYVKDGAGCSNPRPTSVATAANLLIDPVDGDPSDCWKEGRAQPCLLEVELEYDFGVILPIGFDFMGVRYGLGDTITFRRSSTFAVGDFELDED